MCPGNEQIYISVRCNCFAYQAIKKIVFKNVEICFIKKARSACVNEKVVDEFTCFKGGNVSRMNQIFVGLVVIKGIKVGEAVALL